MSDIERTLLIRIKNILEGSGTADARAEIDRLIGQTKEHEKVSAGAFQRVKQGASEMGVAFRSVGAAASGSLGGIAVVLRALVSPLGAIGVAAGVAALAVQAAFRRKTEAAEEHRLKLESIAQQMQNIDRVSMEQARAAAKDLADQYERQRVALSETYQLVRSIAEANTSADQKRDAELGGQSPEERKQRAMEARDTAMARIQSDRANAAQRQQAAEGRMADLDARRSDLTGAADRAQFRYEVVNSEAQSLGAVVGIDTMSADEMAKQLDLLKSQAVAAQKAADRTTAFGGYDKAQAKAKRAAARAEVFDRLLIARKTRDRYQAKRDNELSGIDSGLAAARGDLNKAMSDRSMADVAEKNAMTDYDVAMRDAGNSEGAYRDAQVKGQLEVFGSRLDREPMFRDNPTARDAVMAAAEAELRGQDLVAALNTMVGKLGGSVVLSREQLAGLMRAIDELDGRVGEAELRDRNNRP